MGATTATNTIESLDREILSRAAIPTDISDHLRTLFAESLSASPRLIVELGVRSGESTFALERVARPSNAHLVSVDVDDCSKASSYDRWHFVRSDDLAFARAFTEWCKERGIEPRIDVLFIDTSHEYHHTVLEIEAWFPLLAARAKVFFHDSNPRKLMTRRDGTQERCPWVNEERAVARAIEGFLGIAFDETCDQVMRHRGWALRHHACCHGLTILEREGPEADTRGVWAPSPQTKATVDAFHELYYDRYKQGGTWYDTRFQGVPVWKNPLDLWVYQELVHEIRPDLIVETGTAFGGSALYLASLCDLVGQGEVVSIDVQAYPDRPRHVRLSYLHGSSTDAAIVEHVRRLAQGRRVLVILDSDHRKEHVLAELAAYGPLVSVGGYLIVEDTNVNGHPAYPAFGPGPMEALETFLAESDAFEIDERREKFLLTFNPRGFLRRIR